MRRLPFASPAAAFFILTIASPSAHAALICKDGRLHYGGSEFHANRLEAEASAIEAWRRSVGAPGVTKMFPKSEQLHSARTTPEKAGAASCEKATVTRREAESSARQ